MGARKAGAGRPTLRLLEVAEQHPEVILGQAPEAYASELCEGHIGLILWPWTSVSLTAADNNVVRAFAPFARSGYNTALKACGRVNRLEEVGRCMARRRSCGPRRQPRDVI